MIGSGTVANFLTIVIGSILGLLIKKGIDRNLKEIIENSIGISVMIIGLSGTLGGMFKVAKDGSINSEFTMLLVFSLILGGIIGYLCKIEEGLNYIGDALSTKFSKTDSSLFAQGFVSSSLLFCVGAMAIVGSLEDGLTGSGTTLYIKSVLDGTMAIILTSTLGIGVMFSAIPVVLYQGAITALAVVVKPFMTEIVITQMSVVGNALVLCIGLNILKITRIKIGYLLPATFLPLIFSMFI